MTEPEKIAARLEVSLFGQRTQEEIIPMLVEERLAAASLIRSLVKERDALRGAAIANGLERDEANERLEHLAEAIRRSHEGAQSMLESSEKRWLVGTFDDLARWARPAKLVAYPNSETSDHEAKHV